MLGQQAERKHPSHHCRANPHDLMELARHQLAEGRTHQDLLESLQPVLVLGSKSSATTADGCSAFLAAVDISVDTSAEEHELETWIRDGTTPRLLQSWTMP
jgi:hypothetical protein